MGILNWEEWESLEGAFAKKGQIDSVDVVV